ncbi:siderophore biosynthesis protein, IucA/IucC family [Bacteriovorax sp. BSW11_IV]|uniref:GNAT family N-acetyltransferase n=1 Tax=Bacteriovorax sp. BSW11_IV TaxID=1353529 RepID=UPI000389E53B|nr:GNAT family N-acetyltransferase [Bacteriovorax sp. BSW11_IV]EQC46744.1 siderophore biosynthesis protein, IucA/IucC family [Bacteriovorax sp. BSW11_IV]
MDVRNISEHLAKEILLNSFITETKHFKIVKKNDYKKLQSDCLEVLTTELGSSHIQIFAPIYHKSTVGRYKFENPIYRLSPNGEDFTPITYTELAYAVLNDLSEKYERPIPADTLVRILKSELTLEKILDHNKFSIDEIYNHYQSLLKSEQNLLIGHPFHPVGKARDGFGIDHWKEFSPETKGSFALNYFLVDNSLFISKSAIKYDAKKDILDAFLTDELTDSALKDIVQSKQETHSLLPMHPWQAFHLQTMEVFKNNKKKGLIIELGQTGRRFYPTQSVRTLYSPEVSFMVKFSLNLEITNSKRVMLEKECIRGIDTTNLWDSELGGKIQEEYPTYKILNDFGYFGLKEKSEDEYAMSESLVSIRENPYYGGKSNQNVVVMSTLCQDFPIFGAGQSVLGNLIKEISKATKHDKDKIAVKWFQDFLNVAVKPVVEIYAKYGLAFEAHQQNTVLELHNLMPKRFVYRDNQGVFHTKDVTENLNKYVPGIGHKTESIGPKKIVNERMGYYFIINNVFNLINAFGITGYVKEERLLFLLRDWLIDLRETLPEADTSFITYLLESDELEFKANLLTRFMEMDELVGDPTTQSVYIKRSNPFNLDIIDRSKDLFARARFEKKIDSHNATVTFRPFNLEEDIELLHKWMHYEHVSKFWRQNWNLRKLKAHHEKMGRLPFHNNFIGFVNGEPVSFWEQYWCTEDRINEFTPNHKFNRYDQGMHFLIGEKSVLGKGLAPHLIRAFTDYLFTVCKKTQCVYGEPDHTNQQLLKYLGPCQFKEIGSIRFPEKVATFLECKKEDFYDSENL